VRQGRYNASGGDEAEYDRDRNFELIGSRFSVVPIMQPHMAA